MFSQSLLLALWREPAAPPDSSASSQELTTPGSSPVSDASREANCCWSEVSIVVALAGRLAPPVADAPPVPSALSSAEEKVMEAVPEVVGSDELELVEDAGDGGTKAVCNPEIC